MKAKPWGYSVGLDIKGCNEATIRSAAAIQDFVIQLCKVIDMTRFGDCQVVHFGTGNKEGFSMVQLIETSCITGHFANDSNSAFIDIFSCKEFDIDDVVKFTLEFFGGNSVTAHFAVRGQCD
jgi:S-adenosylmethionine/arginine decarboxylase-like enzyme